MATNLKDEKIFDQWGILIEGAQGKAENIFKEVRQEIENFNAPGIICEMETVKTGLFGKKRQFLRIMNEALQDHRIYIGARDYGVQLSVSWFLTCEPGFFKRKASELIAKNAQALSFALDIFDQQELQDYVSTAHHATLKAVENIMTDLGQDPSKIDKKSKGFLGIS